MLIHTLPAAHKGATHIGFYAIEAIPGSGVTLHGRYGTVDPDRTFDVDLELTEPRRYIRGREAEAFLADTAAKGAPLGNFRANDIVDWLDAWEYNGQGDAWYEANPEVPGA